MAEDPGAESELLPQCAVDYLKPRKMTPAKLKQLYPETFKVFHDRGCDLIHTLNELGEALAKDNPKGDDPESNYAVDASEKLQKYLHVIH